MVVPLLNVSPKNGHWGSAKYNEGKPTRGVQIMQKRNSYELLSIIHSILLFLGISYAR